MAVKKENTDQWNTATTALLAKVELENPIVVHTGSYADKDLADTTLLRLSQNVKTPEYDEANVKSRTKK
jgi:hypothetical protein